ncbi:MAG: hypothetical protein Q7S75_03220 [bacterium]|nr:hypothetical protein [bacterium]
MRNQILKTIPDGKAVFVLTHDAGGAEILAAFIREQKKHMHFVIYAGGPARAIFERERIPYKSEPKRAKLRNVIAKHPGTQALLGTGGPRSIELAALKEAKRQGMETAAYIDSWTNYRERFGYPQRGWQKNLPDEIWVGDASALALAKRYFSTVRTRLVPNQYFAATLSRYRSRAHTMHRPLEILYMSAAARLSEKFLADFLAECSRRKAISIVRVRMHPENNRVRYERVIRRHGRGIRVELSPEKNIVNDLLRARAVVGPETNALVLALLAGIRTIRIVPNGEKSFLPFKKIISVKNAKDAARKIGR